MSVVWHDAKTWRPTPGGPVWTERFRGKLFDSYLGESSHYTQNHALYLFLRIYLNPVANQATALDSKKRPFPAKNWTGVEWSRFKEQFEHQSKIWNNKFWLIPPGHFSIKDKNKLRPNIMCYLITEIAQSPSNAHRVVNVVNLDVDAIKKQRGANPTSGTFKSNARLYDSLDIKKRTNTYEDDRGEAHTVENYSTIAHELGHAIGLPHIGVLKSRPQCTFAVTLKKLGVTNVSSHLSRGANAEVCYGEFDNLGLAENIMGLGTKFEEINAGPWVKTVAMHTNTLERDWRVRLGGIGPQAVR
jgi:hypothetical protein